VYALEEGLHLIRRSYYRAAVSARLAAKSKDIVRPSNALAMWKLKGSLCRRLVWLSWHLWNADCCRLHSGPMDGLAPSVFCA